MTNSDKITINLKAVLLLAILAIMQVLPIIASDKDSIALVNAKWQTLYDGNGVQLKVANFHIFNAPQNVTILTYNVKEFSLQVGVCDTLVEVSRMAESLKADFAIMVASLISQDLPLHLLNEMVVFILVEFHLSRHLEPTGDWLWLTVIVGRCGLFRLYTMI